MLLTKIQKIILILPYCFECLFDLSIAKLYVLFLPFRFYAKKLGVSQYELFYVDMEKKKKSLVTIKMVIKRMPRFVPWKSKCLDQAIAAQRMLKRRGLPTTCYFGVVKSENHEKMNAHAWIRSGKEWIAGYQPNIPYTIVGVYSTDAKFSH